MRDDTTHAGGLPRLEQTEALSEYLVCRFARVETRGGYSGDGERRKPSWQRVARLRAPSISVHEAAKTGRDWGLNRDTIPMAKKKMWLSDDEQRPIEIALKRLQRGDDAWFQTTLVQLDDQVSEKEEEKMLRHSSLPVTLNARIGTGCFIPGVLTAISISSTTLWLSIRHAIGSLAGVGCRPSRSGDSNIAFTNRNGFVASQRQRIGSIGTQPNSLGCGGGSPDASPTDNHELTFEIRHAASKTLAPLCDSNRQSDLGRTKRDGIFAELAQEVTGQMSKLVRTAWTRYCHLCPDLTRFGSAMMMPRYS